MAKFLFSFMEILLTLNSNINVKKLIFYDFLSIKWGNQWID